MFKLSKKAKDNNGNPFTGYVADGSAAADFMAEMASDGDASVPSEPAPVTNASPQPPAAPQQPAPVTASTIPVQDNSTNSAAPNQFNTMSVEERQNFVANHVSPAHPSESQVNLAIKEAEAETELPHEELLPEGTAPDQPEQPIESEPTSQQVPVRLVEEERAAMIDRHKELANLIDWAEHDTAKDIAEVQIVVDDLNSKIEHLRTSFTQDADRLNEDAKIAFKENLEKNINLLKDQINRELAKKTVLESQKDTFIDRIYDALKKYYDSKR